LTTDKALCLFASPYFVHHLKTFDMKSMFIAICLMVSFLSQTSFAAEPAVSQRIVRAFETTFTQAEDARWSTVENLYKVDFQVDALPMFAFYNINGELVVSGKYLAMKQLPKATQQKLSEAAIGYTVTEIIEINEGLNTRYYASLSNESELKVIESTGSKWSTFKKSTK
jgi:hypothetical protein